MPTTYLADMVAQLRIDLGDPVGTPAWSDAALQRAIARSLSAYSLHHPYLQKATIATTLNDYVIDISTLTGLISVDRLEFPVGNKPPYFKPFNIFQNTLFMYEWGTAANCYIYWSGIHVLTDASRTFNIKDNNLITLGAVAFALEQYADTTLVALVNAALLLATAAFFKVTAKITLAESSLTDAAGVATDISTQLGLVGTQLTAALAALAAAISTAGGSIDASIATKLADVSTHITAATTSLTAATTATGAATTRIAAAVTDLASGDDYIPTANIGLDPGGKWAVFAGKDIDAANAYNQEATNFLQQAAQNISEAHAELGYIKTLDDKRNAYIATGQQYISAADSYTKIATELNHKRQAYLSTADLHIKTASSHIQEGRDYQQNAVVYREQAKVIALQAKSKMAAFLRDVVQGSVMRKIKTFTLVPE